MMTNRRTKVYEEVATRLRQWIDSSLKPGDLLPPERQMTDMFGVGRSSIRDALRDLQMAGIVETRHGIGTVVCDPEKQTPQGRLSDPSQFEKEQLADLLDFRRMIEPQLAARAALRASDEEIAELDRIIGRQAERVAAGAIVVEEDRAFHALIAQAAHNGAVLKMLDTIMTVLEPTRQISFQVPGRAAMSLAGHREILAAIRDRNPVAAEQSMRRHLEAVETVLTRRGRAGGKA